MNKLLMENDKEFKQLHSNFKQMKTQHQEKIKQQLATNQQKDEEISLLLAQLDNLKLSNKQNINSPKLHKATQVLVTRCKTKSIQTEPK